MAELGDPYFELMYCMLSAGICQEDVLRSVERRDLREGFGHIGMEKLEIDVHYSVLYESRRPGGGRCDKHSVALLSKVEALS